MRRLLALAVAGLALAVSGCGGPRVVEVAYSAGSARLAPGETLRVVFGEINHSVGDSWHLIGQPDAAVLSEKDEEYDSLCDMPGCGGRLAWTFTAVAAGRTSVVFRYCYRSRPDDNCEPAPSGPSNEPVTLTVTVAEPT
jgi:predicted secreted protein